MNPLKRRILLKLYFLRIFTKNLNLTSWTAGDQYNMVGKNRKEIGLADFAKDETVAGDMEETGKIILSSGEGSLSQIEKLDERVEETLMDPLMA